MDIEKTISTQEKPFLKKIRTPFFILFMLFFFAFIYNASEAEESYGTIKVPKIHKGSFEPSGLLFLKDLEGHLVISDDTKKDQPYLFFLERMKSVNKKVFLIEGADQIEDMESITSDENGAIYILSSGTKSKKGKRKDKREKILRVEQRNESFYETGSFLFAKSLRESLRRVFNKVDKAEVEGAFIMNDEIYLGLRKPTNKGEILIMKVSSLSKSFKEKNISQNQISVWRKLSLPGEYTNKEGISDLFLHKKTLFIATAFNKTKSGRLFSYDLEKNSKLKEITYFPDLQPEAISYDPKSKRLIVLFDSNEKKRKHAIYLRELN